MEKDRSGKLVAIVALLIGVVGLTIGFAAFANTLTIKSEALVTPDKDIFNVDFSNENAANKTAVATGGVTPVLTPSEAVTGFEGQTATIDNGNSTGPIISGLKATFTAPGQSVKYEFYTKNIGELKAYLTDINFVDVASGSGFKKCEKVTEGKESDEIATDSLVAAACNGISLSFTLGEDTYSETTARASFASPKTQHDLESTASEKVTIVISYAAGSTQADGDFTVKFGDIQLVYNSVAS